MSNKSFDPIDPEGILDEEDGGAGEGAGRRAGEGPGVDEMGGWSHDMEITEEEFRDAGGFDGETPILGGTG